MENELTRKLQKRRSVVDSDGSSWVSKNDAVDGANAGKPSAVEVVAETVHVPSSSSASSPTSSALERQKVSSNASELENKLARRRLSSEMGAGTSMPPVNEEKESSAADLAKQVIGRRESFRVGHDTSQPAGSVGSELADKLQRRRSVADSDGGAWEKLPGASLADVDSQRTNSGSESSRPGQEAVKKLAGTQELVNKRVAQWSRSGSEVDKGRSAADVANRPTARRTSQPAGSIDSELANRLQRRRNTVDMEGDAWQKMPEASSADAASQRQIKGVKTSAKDGAKTLIRDNSSSKASGAYPCSGGAHRRKSSLLMSSWGISKDILASEPQRVWQQSTREAFGVLCEGAAEARPWEDLQGGSQTWMVEVFLPAPVQLPALDVASVSTSGVDVAEPSSTSSTERTSLDRTSYTSHPAVLCLTTDGFVTCCVAAQGQPISDGEDETDYARVLTSFSAASLSAIGMSPSAPQVVSFQLSAEPGCALQVRFESLGEAEYCSRCVAQIVPQSLPMVEGLTPEIEMESVGNGMPFIPSAIPDAQEHDAEGMRETQADSDEGFESCDDGEFEAIIAQAAEERISPAHKRDPTPFPKSSVNTEALAKERSLATPLPEHGANAQIVTRVDTQAFLHELDCLASNTGVRPSCRAESAAFLEDLDRLAGFA